jgi:hypothetical protein
MSSGIALMKALEPYNPCFHEEIVQALNTESWLSSRRTGAGRG